MNFFWDIFSYYILLSLSLKDYFWLVTIYQGVGISAWLTAGIDPDQMGNVDYISYCSLSIMLNYIGLLATDRPQLPKDYIYRLYQGQNILILFTKISLFFSQPSEAVVQLFPQKSWAWQLVHSVTLPTKSAWAHV